MPPQATSSAAAPDEPVVEVGGTASSGQALPNQHPTVEFEEPDRGLLGGSPTSLPVLGN